MSQRRSLVSLTSDNGGLQDVHLLDCPGHRDAGRIPSVARPCLQQPLAPATNGVIRIQRLFVDRFTVMDRSGQWETGTQSSMLGVEREHWTKMASDLLSSDITSSCSAKIEVDGAELGTSLAATRLRWAPTPSASPRNVALGGSVRGRLLQPYTNQSINPACL
jgi:hypothetical protein